MDPVKKVFWEDPYRTELVTTVTSVADNVITLKETIVYAFSGGQQSDVGTINNFPILEAKKLGKQIFYTIEENHHLNVGDTVVLKIDWAKRYKIMRLHFAAVPTLLQKKLGLILFGKITFPKFSHF